MNTFDLYEILVEALIAVGAHDEDENIDVPQAVRDWLEGLIAAAPAIEGDLERAGAQYARDYALGLLRGGHDDANND
jgi:hypothetical protein